MINNNKIQIMKKFLFISCLVFVTSITMHAQSSLLANYPLTKNGIDTSGQNDPMLLKNIVFENGGVYSNGIYSGNDTTGSQIRTPPFTTFDYNNFTVLLDFKIDSYPENSEPIVIGGYLWRWIGAYIDNGKIAFMANDFSTYDVSEISVPLNQWNSIRFSYNKEVGECYFYFNNNLVSSYPITEFNSGDDPRFVNEHGGSGKTFKGYWRNLVFYNSSSIDGIPESNTLNTISINVNSNILNIDVPIQTNGVSLTIVDLQGRVVNTAKLKTGLNTIYLRQQEGVFFVILHKINGESLSRKFIITP